MLSRGIACVDQSPFDQHAYEGVCLYMRVHKLEEKFNTLIL